MAGIEYTVVGLRRRCEQTGREFVQVITPSSLLGNLGRTIYAERSPILCILHGPHYVPPSSVAQKGNSLLTLTRLRRGQWQAVPHTSTVGEYVLEVLNVARSHPFQEVRDKVGLRRMMEGGKRELELICQLENRDEQ